MQSLGSPRIVIEDLPALEELSEEEMARILALAGPGFGPASSSWRTGR